METRNTIVAQLDNFRGSIVHIGANISGRTEPKAEMIIMIILGYIAVLLILLYIHRKLVKKQKRIHENLVLLYDTLRYQVAKVQYSNPLLQDNKGIDVIIENEHKSYLANAKISKEEILSMEQKSGQQIVSADQRKTITKQTNKKHKVTTFVQLIGRCITLLTAGIYKVFW